jgi:D-sedoheptulose 7-phosphate isomerase
MREYLDHFLATVRTSLESVPSAEIAKAISILHAVYERDGKIYVFGNGGSLALSNHWVADLNKTVFNHDLNGSLRRFQAMRIPSTEEELTAWANDEGFDTVFAGPLKSQLRDSDVVVAISTSGKSANIVNAVALAKARKIPVIGISGFDGGRLNELADAKICVAAPQGEREIVESVHAAILHLFTRYFRDHFEHSSRL